MNGIEKITARIETDVKAEIAAILKEGEERAAKIRVDYEAKAKAEAAAAQEAGRQAAARQLERLESAAKMDAKKELLAAKQECLDEAFAKLPPILRDAYTMFQVGEMSVRDIANQTGVSENLVKVRIFRAKEKLQGILADLRVTF